MFNVQRSTFTGSTFTHETPTVDGKVFLTCLLMADEAEEVSIESNRRGEKSLLQVWQVTAWRLLFLFLGGSSCTYSARRRYGRYQNRRLISPISTAEIGIRFPAIVISLPDILYGIYSHKTVQGYSRSVFLPPRPPCFLEAVLRRKHDHSVLR